MPGPRELRAQIELARKHLPRVTHLSAHMGTATSTPELRRLVERLSREHELSGSTAPAAPATWAAAGRPRRRRKPPW
ncbi:MAG: hypothetical protein O7J95_11965 [Planctomycetota bacterium]|nr:hypothetical protein [Planctomycetota bacterium]